jgi:Icc-related predicted phosphoesterase
VVSVVTALLLSDIHGRLSLLKKIVGTSSYDLALVAGDVSNYSGGAYRDVLEILSNNLPLTVVVPGNVDPPELARLSFRNVIVIHKQVIEAGGLYIAGVGGGIGFAFWGIPYLTDTHLGSFVEELEKSIESKSSKPHVLLTHTPPYMSGLDRIHSGEYVGSKRIRELVEKYLPTLHVCGHIHEGRGVANIGRTVAVNPGPAMVGYYATAKFLDKDEKVEVELKKV